MKLSIALSGSLASYAAGIQPPRRTICKTGKNCILNLRKMQLSNGHFVEIGNKRVKNLQEESNFCIGYRLSRFEPTQFEDISRYQKQRDSKIAGFYPICIADYWHQTDYNITWENTGTTGCYYDISKCGSADAFCCSAYHGQDKNGNCPLGAQRAAIQPEDYDGYHNGHFCVKRHMSPVHDPNVRVEEPLDHESPIDESNDITIDESNDITIDESNDSTLGYTCSGFSMCLPNPKTYQPEGNILCSVTYNDRTSALQDCLASDCSHLLEYEFRGSSKFQKTLFHGLINIIHFYTSK